MTYKLIDVNMEKKMDNALHYVAKHVLETGHNSKPILFHSFKIAFNLYISGYSEEIVISAILHDLIEDTSVTKEDIEEQFETKISNIVMAVSFNPKISDKFEQAKLMFENCYNYGYDALIVKCADLLDNINFINLVEDNTTRLELLRKYELFLKISKDKIGNEKIYKDLYIKFKLIR